MAFYLGSRHLWIELLAKVFSGCNRTGALSAFIVPLLLRPLILHTKAFGNTRIQNRNFLFKCALWSGKSPDAVNTVQTGKEAANCQKSRHKSGLTAISLLRITIRLNRLKVEYTFSGGYANNPNYKHVASAEKV